MSRPETTDARLTRLYDLWQERCGDRALPDRADFPPEVLKPWLGNLILIEIGEDGHYRYRLYGSAFVYRFGVEMTKRSIDDLPPEQSAAIREEYDAVVKSGNPMSRLYTSGFDIFDINRRLGIKRVETWERLVLPLASGGGRVAMLMVAAYEQSVTEPSH
ncbi:MAG: PAS domain-containing protein [Rhodospirillaceae bacterium]